MKRLSVFVSALIILLSFGCNMAPNTTAAEAAPTEPSHSKKETKQRVPLTKDFKQYWYNGEAEISSFELLQERYGELRNGTAVLIFVTEDFLPNIQVKANNYNKTNTSVLKLNSTKKFNTGIYPYSIMESTFYPVGQQSHALKVSASVQEWCGQVYAQINNREGFNITLHSYFQGEADQAYTIDQTYLENELWNIIRINPNQLPVGNFSIIPSLEFTRLRHQNIKAYSANAVLTQGSYTLTYPNLERKLVINFNPEFPHEITGWQESNSVGYGNQKEIITTTAKPLKRIRSAYWSKNKNSDAYLRNELGLK